jgi:hypothetical protein
MENISESNPNYNLQKDSNHYLKNIRTLWYKLLQDENNDYQFNQEIITLINSYKGFEYRSFLFYKLANILNIGKRKSIILSSIFYLFYIYDLLHDIQNNSHYYNEEDLFNLKLNINTGNRNYNNLITNSIPQLMIEIVLSDILKINNDSKLSIIKSINNNIGRNGLLYGHFISITNKNKITDSETLLRIWKLKVSSIFNSITDILFIVAGESLLNTKDVIHSYVQNLTSMIKIMIDLDYAINNNILFSHSNINLDLIKSQMNLFYSQSVNAVEKGLVDYSNTEPILHLSRYIYDITNDKINLLHNP